jgi:hypothetical protein
VVLAELVAAEQVEFQVAQLAMVRQELQALLTQVVVVARDQVLRQVQPAAQES